MADEYGIPEGGNNGPYSAHTWGGHKLVLPWKELMAMIALAGWPQNDWGMAGAIAAAESSRQPFIYNTYKKGMFGLFQISRAAWPDFFAGGNKQWVAGTANAKQARIVFKKQGWKAWEAYTNGGYLAYYPAAMAAAADLQRKTGLHGGDEQGYWNSLISKKTFDATMAAMGVTGQAVSDAIGASLTQAIGTAADATAQGTVDSGAAVASAVNQSFGWLPDFYRALTTPAIWMRFAYGAAGVVLVAGGLFLIVKNRPVVQKTASAVASAVPAGRVAKVAGAVKGAKK